MGIAEEKSHLRKQILEQRRALPPDAVEARSQSVIGQLRRTAMFQQAEAVLSYLSFDNEVATANLISELLAGDRAVFVPRCVKGGLLRWSRLRRNTVLQVSKFGIMEPAFADEIWAAGAGTSLVLAPGIAFGREGQRLGYGGGYFDRFLQGFDGYAVGLAYDFQVLPELPEQAHDRRLDAVISESRVYEVPAQASTRPKIS